MNPGFTQVMLYRWAYRLRHGGRIARFLSVIIWRWGVASSGCYMSALARIGHNLYLPHHVGIVIGDGTRIGDDAVI